MEDVDEKPEWQERPRDPGEGERLTVQQSAQQSRRENPRHRLREKRGRGREEAGGYGGALRGELFGTSSPGITQIASNKLNEAFLT